MLYKAWTDTLSTAALRTTHYLTVAQNWGESNKGYVGVVVRAANETYNKLNGLWWQIFCPILLLHRAVKAMQGPAQCVLIELGALILGPLQNCSNDM